MTGAAWVEAGVATGLLALAALARAAAARHAALAATHEAERRAAIEAGREAEPGARDAHVASRAAILSAELAWAALLASALLLGAHAALQLLPGVLRGLALLAFAALVLGDAVPARRGERQVIPRRERYRKQKSRLAFLSRPVRSLASHLARRRTAGSPAEPAAAADEEKLLQRLLDASTNGEAGQEGETAVVRRLLGRVLHLRETLVASVMCPRSEIVWIGHRERPPAAALLMRESGHTRIPICGRDLDDVVGVLHLKDVFLALHGVPPEATVGAIGREPAFMDADTHLGALLGAWRRQSGTMSIVRDPFGRVVGLITLSDVLGWLLPGRGGESMLGGEAAATPAAVPAPGPPPPAPFV